MRAKLFKFVYYSLVGIIFVVVLSLIGSQNFEVVEGLVFGLVGLLGINFAVYAYVEEKEKKIIKSFKKNFDGDIYKGMKF